LPFKLGNYLVNLIYKNAKADENSKIFITMEKLNIELMSKPLIMPHPMLQQQRKDGGSGLKPSTY
jgi:hypothetical protein